MARTFYDYVGVVLFCVPILAIAIPAEHSTPINCSNIIKEISKPSNLPVLSHETIQKQIENITTMDVLEAELQGKGAALADVTSIDYRPLQGRKFEISVAIKNSAIDGHYHHFTVTKPLKP